MTNGKRQMINRLTCSQSSGPIWLHIEPEMHNVSILNNVLFSFQLQLALLAATRFAPEFHQILEASDLRSDESALDVRVNNARRLMRGRAALDRPSPAFVLTRSQKADQVEQ